MIDINKLKIPLGVMQLPRDSRGIPIPFIQYIPPTFAQDRKVNFKITDPEKVTQCLINRLCGICGDPIAGMLYFIGGPLSRENRIYSDPCMHGNCAEFAIQACPFLNNPRYSVKDMDLSDKPNVIQDAFMAAERPSVMSLMKCREFHLVEIKDGESKIIHPQKYAMLIDPVLVREF